MKVPMISFRAKCINNTVKTPALDFTNKWSDAKSSFVELHADDEYDKEVMKKTSDFWQFENNGKITFANNICFDFFDDDYNRNCFFALTKQPFGHERLDFAEILGMAEVEPLNSDVVNLTFLQVDPLNKTGAPERKVKKIGTRIIEAIRDRFLGKSIEVDPAMSAVDFYLKLGFRLRPFSRKLILYA